MPRRLQARWSTSAAVQRNRRNKARVEPARPCSAQDCCPRSAAVSVSTMAPPCPSAYSSGLLRTLLGGARASMVAPDQRRRTIPRRGCRRGGKNYPHGRSEEHTSELQSLMRISYAVFCLKKKNKQTDHHRK